MQLFRMKVQAEGKHPLSEYVQNHYVRFGRQRLGDLSLIADYAELAAKLAKVCPLTEVQQQTAMHMLFAHVMQDGDYILVSDGERTYLGDLGDYYYVEECDTEEEDSGHRRGVTWLQQVDAGNVHPEVTAFLEQDGEIGQFHRPLSREQLDQLLVKPAAPTAASWIDAETISEAVAILKEAMQSKDIERRERAAIALLQAAAQHHLHRPASLE
ncbi:hypothetical protein [Paenibacillus sp. OV219]|uniref:hypothetical protein n=1 Tax=Paenibacillus sp. OV219 TaxID=1884377 RepID=UPI0008B4CA91|nr:hypothetical protein [Paenibacillus sp. OV219]SEO82544.1 hypothetical protein SAMN05518847_111106 [Paenibacillus sp. OV219]